MRQVFERRAVWNRDQIHFCLDIRTKQRLEIDIEKGPKHLQGV